jgi:hypothetical protein
LHIFILEELYTRIAYKIINPSIDSIISIFEKWKYKPEFDQNKKEEKFQKRLDGLRQLLSFKICEGNERRDSIMNYFRTNEDKNLRYGYYQVYDPTKESIIQHFEKDKELFIEAGIENYHFYLRRNEEEIEIADLFFEYKNKIKKEYLDFEYNYKKTTLKQEAPTLFINEEFYDRDLDEGELIKEIDKNSKLIDSILTSKIKDSKEQSEQENVKIIYWLGRQIKFSAELQDKILERIRNIRNLEQQIKEQSAQIQNLKGWAIVALIAVVVLAVLK